MPRSDSYGTVSMGRWEWVNDNSGWVWKTVEDDPYRHLCIGPEPPEWWNNNIDAKNYVERMREAHGIDTEFTFGLMTMTWGAMVERTNKLEHCQRDPLFIVEYFKKTYYFDGYWAQLIAGAKEEHDEELFMCINPQCLRVYYFNERDEFRALRQCGNCGGFTMVHETLLLESGPPDGTIMNMMFYNMHTLDRMMMSHKILSEMATTHDSVRIHYRSQGPCLRISTEIPQLNVNGDHFIRGRVNREVMEEHGLNVHASEIVIGFSRVDVGVVSLLRRLFSDPGIMLDEGKAEKFRQEYIDGQWEDEFIAFVNQLRGRGVLKVDSSGVHDTLTAIYNMAQKSSGKKTIIKRSGKIVFPTQAVLENISQPLIERAFSITEHGRYKLEEAFDVGGGAAE